MGSLCKIPPPICDLLATAHTPYALFPVSFARPPNKTLGPNHPGVPVSTHSVVQPPSSAAVTVAAAAVVASVAMLPTANAMTPEECTSIQEAGVNITCAQYDELVYIDFSHTAFIIVCMALVNLMTPGLAFFYGGLVRERSVVAMMIQSWISMGVITIVWVVIGFSLAFGVPNSKFAGSPSTYPMMLNVDGSPLTYTDKLGEVHVTAAAIPGIAFAGYQGMFAVITPALMTGAFADRLRFAPYLVFIAVWLIIIYCPVCHCKFLFFSFLLLFLI